MYDQGLWKELGLSEQDLNRTIDIPGRSTRTEKTNWGIKECKIISKKYKIPNTLWELTEQVNVLNRFLNFYGTGFIPSTHNVVDIVLSMASMIFKDKPKNSNDLIWEDDLKSDDEMNCGFSIKGESPIPISIDTHFDKNPQGTSNEATTEDEEQYENLLKIIGIQSSPRDLGTSSGIVFETTTERDERLNKNKPLRLEENIEKLTTLTKQFLYSYKEGSLKQFLAEAVMIFSKYPPANGINRLHLHIFQVANFLALTMLRKVTKTEAQMTNAFLKEQYKRNVASLIPGTLSSKFAPPCKECIDQLSGISKNDPAVSSFIAKLVILWIEEESKNPTLTASLGASILTHTAWNGMGILHLIFEVCLYHQISWKKLLKETFISSTLTSWKEISQFFFRYQEKGHEERSVPWSRVIDDSYFMRLNISSHTTLASLLVESIIKSQGDEGILNANWAVLHRSEIEYLKPAALYLTSKLSGTEAKVNSGTVDAQTLVKIINNRSKTITINQDPSDNDLQLNDSDL